MNSKTVKVILGAALIGFMSVSSLLAQDPPAAEVNQDGNLVLNPGTAEEEIIQKPDGTVDQNGDLTVGGVTITKPTATVEPDGSLTLGDGTNLAVPDGPPSELPAVIQWFNTGTDPKNETVPYSEGSPWHWSYTYKGLSVEGMPEGFVWMREFGSVVYPFQDSGTPDGAWFYFFDFPKRDGQGNFVYLSSPIFKNRMETPASVIDGWAYVIGEGYNKWYVVKEFDDIAEAGTYMFASAEESYRLTMEP
ncbi:MAG: hypothetical protein AB3N63_08775 [Puniceicoccaceae bacterium]